MGRLIEDLIRRPLLHKGSVMHYLNAITHAGHHAHVMGDEADGRIQLPPQFLHQIEDLGLHRHVERGGRFVGDQKVGLAQCRHGDHHPLAHAPGKFVGILPHPPFRFRDPDPVEHSGRPGARIDDTQPLVTTQNLCELITDGQVGREGGQRILKDHGHA